MNLNWWQNRPVVITGASSGIGRALALGLAGSGMRIGLIARRTELLEQLCVELRSRGAEVAAAPADVTNLEQTRRAVGILEERLGPCSIAVANAGVHHYTPGPEFDPQAAAEVVRTNVIGVTNTIGSVLPRMVSRGNGHLVAIASIAGIISLPRMGTYGASKAAVIALMNSLSVDLKPHGVRVTTICPGFVETPLIAKHNKRLLIFKITAEEAAARIIHAIEQNKRICHFPWPTYALVRLGRMLPFSLYARWIRRISDRARAKPAP